MRLAPLASTLAVAVLVAACGRFGGSEPVRGGVAPLQPQPIAPVAAQPLPPPVVAPVTPVAPAPVDTAALTPNEPTAATAVEIRKPDLSGGWKLASAGENCQLFMNLTSWTGGYRANTRGCASDELKSIGAWDLDGKQVVLKDASGSVVATLYASAATRFSGQTAISKRGIQVFR
ncbi:protease inhibitor Inh/omp19 family protein [Oharaeibacter diazotrophicus]|uniref:Protease inhibitor Inh n=1 Tax=Oharaeibacter diazotrophicus TaxID=1920512 RepID=A0A4R6R803_9HYPH|nr:protease inhibitor Inh/omp19 family protein [Oharaeibacter diazotrophicus]TDP81984.1 protease inhibitor Inh [Oharaeibacter diazotrophicus]BBE73616.1 protease inhibitor Inh [Pleomorphomonas sp. SM30]GLS75405.1 hypothetical protein GCM10007904_07400 [Oharaeibacter diazotrophicus]